MQTFFRFRGFLGWGSNHSGYLLQPVNLTILSGKLSGQLLSIIKHHKGFHDFRKSCWFLIRFLLSSHHIRLFDRLRWYRRLSVFYCFIFTVKSFLATGFGFFIGFWPCCSGFSSNLEQSPFTPGPLTFILVGIQEITA